MVFEDWIGKFKFTFIIYPYRCYFYALSLIHFAGTKTFFFSSQNRFIFKIACALLLFPHDFSNFTPFFVPLNDLWVPLYTFETQFSKSPKPLKTLGTIENKRTWAFHSGSNFWRRTRDSNPRGCYTLLAFQASSLATRSILQRLFQASL